jgi:hypothetical protein
MLINDETDQGDQRAGALSYVLRVSGFEASSQLTFETRRAIHGFCRRRQSTAGDKGPSIHDVGCKGFMRAG